MGEWRECKLRDVIDYIARGISPKYSESDGTIVINQKCIRDGKINYEFIKVNDFSKKISDEKFLKQYDTLVNSTGVGTLGRVGLYDLENDTHTADSHVMIVRASKDVEKRWFFYNLFSRQDEIELLGEGSTGQIELSRLRLADLDISLPPLKGQKVIAEVLSSLDDKIDLLHRQNKTLEELAQTLFRQWFIEEANDNWEVTTLGNLGKAVTGKTPSTQNTEFWGDGIYFVTPTDFKYYGKYTTFSDRSLSLLGVKKVKNSVLPINSILVTCIGSDMGKVAIAQSQCVSNQQINSLIIEDSILVEYVYQHLKYIYPLLRAIAMGGTTMPIINKTDFENIEITLPRYDLIEKFHEVTSSFNEKIIQNTNQIKTLENLRDTLLPKLMSGEVRVEF